jgi:hypothetical protein
MYSLMESAIEILSKSFDGAFNVKKVNEEVFTNENRKIGLFIEIEGIQSFLTIEVASDIVNYGDYIARHFIFLTLKEQVINIKRDVVISTILKT